MTSNQRAFLNALHYEEYMRFLQQMGGYCMRAQGKPFLAPWLPPESDLAQLRRTAHRLRTRQIDYNDPRLPAPLLADMIDLSVDKHLTLRAIVRNMRDSRATRTDYEEQFAEVGRRNYTEKFHQTKKSAEEAKKMDRKLRRQRGRARRRKHGMH